MQDFLVFFFYDSTFQKKNKKNRLVETNINKNKNRLVKRLIERLEI